MVQKDTAILSTPSQLTIWVPAFAGMSVKG